MTAWTTPTMVVTALGPSAAPPIDDEWLVQCCAAANAAAYRKRHAAGYTDDPADLAPAPDAAVAQGATMWAVALWRERASVDGYQSFEDLAAFTPTGGAWGEIKRMLGIPRAAVDAVPTDLAVNPLARRRRRLLRYGRLW